jgi:hypothetical protein
MREIKLCIHCPQVEYLWRIVKICVEFSSRTHLIESLFVADLSRAVELTVPSRTPRVQCRKSGTHTAMNNLKSVQFGVREESERARQRWKNLLHIFSARYVVPFATCIHETMTIHDI